MKRHWIRHRGYPKMALNALPATWVRSQGIQMRAFCGMGVMFSLGGGIDICII